MPPERTMPSSIKNKIKREEVARKAKRTKRQDKLQKRLERAKIEAKDPAVKRKRLEENVPRTLDNTREYDPSFLTANPASSSSAQPDAGPSNTQQDGALEGTHIPENDADFANDPFASYFTAADPTKPPKVLVTTSPRATRASYEFCEELCAIFPGSEFVRRNKKSRGFEMGRIAGWAAGRGYGALMVVNEDMKKPNAITIVHLPEGPTAYFKLTSIQLSKQIHGHARATAHYPELVLNGFVTRLGHAVGRMFQTLFPPLPEFQGRQVVTLHNQRDFLFFRRHRYAFRSTEKVALQEIGPRFTLKLRSLRKGLPAVQNLGVPPKPLEFDNGEVDDEEQAEAERDQRDGESGGDNAQDDVDVGADPLGEKEKEKRGKASVAPTQDEYQWMWKPELETTRRTFFL
ncbi:Brix-domain-containing protein [Punctularia strigosozonata HHB-11173 SS5]|uniref:Brix-domain-containing protein n=1 Tax=Punctularia strigosozonata (strain HHB-11173) TaxID=741275 RepID=UPI0004416D3B|nr:Brix-domain-containing protein [Punctularia strigosozonata HHB-11173 SS5]EIN06043.1 Brix-domain-containing protein [Punctularia strigosozonata HHB-11173 SS5]